MSEVPDARGFVRKAVFAIVLLTISVAPSAADVIVSPTLTMNPTGRTPLAGVVELETDTPVQVQLTISDGTDTWTVSFPEAVQVHYLPVLGLKPDRSYTVDVELIPGGLAGSLMTTTGPLPVDFPVMAVQVSSPLQMEPGYTLIDCYRRDPVDTRARYSMIVDSAGDVVWYSTVCSTDLRQTVNGNLLFRSGAEMWESDMLGYTELQAFLADPGTGLHHDHLRTPMGTYLSLSRQSILVPDFPTSVSDPNAPTADTIVRDEPVVEFFPDGTLREQWLLTDMIDPTRIGYDSLNQTADGRDWAHANAVVYDPSDDSFIASLRHQDAVIKFSRTTGELVWILGPHDNWTAEFQPFLLHPVDTPFEWQYHQHAPMLTGDGTLVLFDNGNRRASPFDGVFVGPSSDFYSRGVEYEIDEEAMQVRQVWEYGGNIAERIYTDRISDADWLETTGNVMMTFGSVGYTGGVASVDLGLGTTHARIIEATDAPTPETVFDLILYDLDGGIIRVYRADRIPSLYPQQYVKSPNGVGNTLLASETPGSFLFEWAAPPEDPAHSPADHFVVFVSDRPDAGFQIMDTAIQTSAEPAGDTSAVFYKIVAANTAGTSGDEPPP